jgi:hypothetical protein
VFVLLFAATLFRAGFESDTRDFWVRHGVNIYIGFACVAFLGILGTLGVGVALILELLHHLSKSRPRP